MNSWLRGEPAPDVATLTFTELLEVWRASRNSLLGLVAAEEVCRRMVALQSEPVSSRDAA